MELLLSGVFKMTIKEMQVCATETLTYFMQTMPDVPFTEDDIIIEFAHKRDMVNCVKKHITKCCQKELINESQARQLANVIAGKAVIGKEKSAVIIRIDYKTNNQNLRTLLFHEFMHIFCGKLEMDNDHFVDIYGTGLPQNLNPADEDYTTLDAGYTVWSEFIAQYYAVIKTEEGSFTYSSMSEYIVGSFSAVHNDSKENSQLLLAAGCSYLFACKDFDDTLYNIAHRTNSMLDDNAPYGRETKMALLSCLEHLRDQIQKEKPWKINEEFIFDLGERFLWFKTMNSIYLGTFSK